MYGKGSAEDSAILDAYDQIQISSIPDRSGQFLRNALIDRLYRSGRPADAVYKLDVSPIEEKAFSLDITKQADTTRIQLKLQTTMVLKSVATEETLFRRNLTAITSYNVLESQFTTRVSAKNARENALNDLARQIEMQLGLYFKRQN